MEKTNQAVVFQDVSKSFGQVNAVRELNFNIEPGQLITLLGPSGCGKTTTLRLIAGLEMVSKGKIFIGDKDVTHVSASDRDVSMVFQSYALFPHMNVFQNVSYGLTISRLPKEEVREKAEAALGLVGLADYGERLPSDFQEDSNSGLRSQGHWFWNRKFCCLTNPSLTWMPSYEDGYARKFVNFSRNWN